MGLVWVKYIIIYSWWDLVCGNVLLNGEMNKILDII